MQISWFDKKLFLSVKGFGYIPKLDIIYKQVYFYFHKKWHCWHIVGETGVLYQFPTWFWSSENHNHSLSQHTWLTNLLYLLPRLFRLLNSPHLTHENFSEENFGPSNQGNLTTVSLEFLSTLYFLLMLYLEILLYIYISYLLC